VPADTTRRVIEIVLTLYVPLALGYALTKAVRWRTGWTRPTMVWLMVIVEPPITMYSLWVLKAGDVAGGGGFLAGIGAMVLAAALVSTAMIFPARAASELLGHDDKTRGSFIAASMFSNVGFTLGLFICLLFLGVRGQALGVVWTAYFLPYFVTIGFAVGRHYGRTARKPLGKQALGLLTEPLSSLPLAGFAAGLILHEVASQPPEWIRPINKWAVHVEVAAYAFAIGCTLRLRSVRRYWRECAAICGMKFLVMPVIGFGVWAVLSSIGVLSNEPIVMKVVLIQCCMPAAIMSVVLSKLFGLNEDLASAAWVVTTITSAVVLPTLYLVVRNL
jgi:predicted permease